MRRGRKKCGGGEGESKVGRVEGVRWRLGSECRRRNQGGGRGDMGEVF
jgi:hypothetical protein